MTTTAVLAEASAETATIESLFWISLVAVFTPIIARAARGYVPDAVLLLLAGMVIGPNLLGWASVDGLTVLNELGLGMLFLLAGFELDPKLLGGRPGRVARVTWLVSLGFAVGFVALVVPDAGFTTFVAVGIAMTSTALGTLLPIIKQLGLLDKPVGRAVMANGAVGELGPILAMSLLLTSRNVGAAVVVLILFAVAALVIAYVPAHVIRRVPFLGESLRVMSSGTIQLPIRVVLLLLVGLMTVAAVFDLDVVLGAFAAGMILRRLLGDSRAALEGSLDVIGFGVFIPIFFVISGMAIDIHAVLSAPGTWAGFVLAIAVARGLPVWFSERFVIHGANLPSVRERAQLALYAATGLPIIVAVTQVAVGADLLSTELASAMVAAGATTVLVFPLIARLVGDGAPRTD
ncbi:cation:proton antiporter [Gordonia sp. ABSL49_1]|uniref:cation:proton antiporter n=1 Tax=Gordonia sp. ABSL49_1 TaxID=2920941 RepID=UPI001F10F553|nr:cation:proton antiporter [Gordonia sp. ABSL49_1]MCH5643678.1 cation:proton antiporter [Gordonia sp. ABSL49_1]